MLFSQEEGKCFRSQTAGLGVGDGAKAECREKRNSDQKKVCLQSERSQISASLLPHAARRRNRYTFAIVFPIRASERTCLQKRNAHRHTKRTLSSSSTSQQLLSSVCSRQTVTQHTATTTTTWSLIARRTRTCFFRTAAADVSIIISSYCLFVHVT